MHGIGLCVLINRISLVNCIAASTRLRGTILIIQVLNIAGNVIVKESGMTTGQARVNTWRTEAWPRLHTIVLFSDQKDWQIVE